MMGSSGGGQAAADDLLNLLQVMANPDKYKEALATLQEQKDLTAKGIAGLDKAKADFEKYSSDKKAELAELETQTTSKVNAALSTLAVANAANVKTTNDLAARAADLDIKYQEIQDRTADVNARNRELVDQRDAITAAQAKLKADQDAFNKDQDEKLAAGYSRVLILDKREAELKATATDLDQRQAAFKTVLDSQKAAMASLK